jgi:putative acetyltransferase
MQVQKPDEGKQQMPTISVHSDDPRRPEVRLLIEQLDGYLMDLYPPQSNHLLSVELLAQPEVTFLTARVDGRLAGCGALINQGGEYAEIKRMFVVPEFRGLRIGRLLLEELEHRAEALGLDLARLETGVRQPEAIALYERAGYQRRGVFGTYTEDPLCIYMEKRLG